MSYAYSPVAAFHLERDYEGRAVGYAAPTGGAPVLLKLTSDQTPIAFVRATAYSQAAADAGLRSGWCGFTLTGLSEAFAVGDDVELKCVAVIDPFRLRVEKDGNASKQRGDGKNQKGR